MVFEHPFHNRYAFASTGGATHFRTSPSDPSTRTLPRLSLPSTLFPSDPKKFGCVLFQCHIAMEVAGGDAAAIHVPHHLYTSEIKSSADVGNICSETPDCGLSPHPCAVTPPIQHGLPIAPPSWPERRQGALTEPPVESRLGHGCQPPLQPSARTFLQL
ncbi:hypothetical protein BKA70DRAFT_106589 [Coprinopsis sp. MPI-PUGE-AT-0042]|nr:hypothetical protein BKA70DRAFT_106589 [Coprinopsis sp. MPI-PUGE-AT-0042]